MKNQESQSYERDEVYHRYDLGEINATEARIAAGEIAVQQTTNKPKLTIEQLELLPTKPPVRVAGRWKNDA